jgi:hypothetical protein
MVHAFIIHTLTEEIVSSTFYGGLPELRRTQAAELVAEVVCASTIQSTLSARSNILYVPFAQFVYVVLDTPSVTLTGRTCIRCIVEPRKCSSPAPDWTFGLDDALIGRLP